MGHKKEHKHKHKKEHKHKHKKERKRKYSDSDDEKYEKRSRYQDDADKKKKHSLDDPGEKPKQHSRKLGNERYVEESALSSTADPSLSKSDTPPIPTNDIEPVPEGGKSHESLSIEETNKLRVKLGLKPLQVDEGRDAEGGTSKEEEFVHKPAEDLWNKKKQDEIRQKLLIAKEKRLQQKKLAKVRSLGQESDDEESATAWVQKSKKREAQIIREKEMKKLENEFGVDNLVKSEMGTKSMEAQYSERDLQGMSVEHNIKSFKEGKSQILVIKDKGVLDEDHEDVLHSVNIEDNERYERNMEMKRKGTSYKAYAEEEVDELGFFKAKVVLDKYDDEIDGEKRNRFTIGARGTVDTTWEQQKEQMKKEIRAKGESLTLAPLKLASEYLTPEEMTFKKRKRKVKKVRKRATKADDLLPLPGLADSVNHGSRGNFEPGKIPGWDEGVEITNRYQSEEPKVDNIINDEDESVEELQRALAKSRRAKMKSRTPGEDGAVAVKMHQEKLNEVTIEKPGYSNELYLNATDEFCRQLGNQILTRQQETPVEPPEEEEVTNGEEDMDIDHDNDEEMTEPESKWSSVNSNTVSSNSAPKHPIDDGEKPLMFTSAEEHAPIEAEPLAAKGVMGALQLAKRKGYLEEESVKRNAIITTNMSELKAQNYSIEDKNAVDYLDKYAHEKYSKDRTNRYDRGGMTTDFNEKKDYKPKLHIEYVDDRGRTLSAKEAFRKLSHRFHGKGSGKSKLEKRMKKLAEEDTMKRMSSTDTPLNTVAMMQDKQRTEASPYIVLSGGGKTLMTGGGENLSKK